MITLFGADGNMGRRYKSILNYLGRPFLEVDVNTPRTPAIWKSDHYIVATPTDDHTNRLTEILCQCPMGSHILCEKPISKYVDRLIAVFNLAEDKKCHLWCVNQYAFLPEAREFQNAIGDTYYNYFNHGKDGLYWDCFQLFALSRRTPFIDEDSPKWTCRINGIGVDLRNMDKAYVYMLTDFLGDKKNLWGRETVIRTTKKVLEAVSNASS